MSESPVSYRLRYSAVEYSRRGGQMSSLLFSLAQQALIWEAQGQAVEIVSCHLTGDGDYAGFAVVDPGGSPLATNSSAAAAVDSGEVRSVGLEAAAEAA